MGSLKCSVDVTNPVMRGGVRESTQSLKSNRPGFVT